METIPISNRLSCFPCTEQPLCADVGIVYGDSCTWLFDVGSGSAMAQAICTLPGRKNAVLSHFHPDHSANHAACGCENLFCSANTGRYLRAAEKTPVIQTVASPLTLHDGVELCIFPLPSCHAKGSLGLEVDGRYAFVGDALYSTVKEGRPAYNVSLLKQTIDALKALRAETLLISHHKPFLREKHTVLTELEALYARRRPGEPYLFLSFQ